MLCECEQALQHSVELLQYVTRNGITNLANFVTMLGKFMKYCSVHKVGKVKGQRSTDHCNLKLWCVHVACARTELVCLGIFSNSQTHELCHDACHLTK